MKKGLRVTLRIAAIAVAAVILVVGVYIAYVFLAYYRIEDNLPLEAETPVTEVAPIGGTFTVTTSNIGFGAYSADYTFFMDGGTESVARSPEAVRANTAGSTAFIADVDPDFALFQEVDIDSTRSYHIDQRSLLAEALPGYSSTFALNYDSPFLFYPILQPHGKSVAGLETMSRYAVTGATRRSLPIDEGVGKLIDLDRCYTVTRVATDGSAELVLFNVHLTAYTDDATIVLRQFRQLFGEMRAEYDKGNYVVCGGDFNCDLWGDSTLWFPGRNACGLAWPFPMPADEVPEGILLAVPAEDGRSVATCRDAGVPYDPDTTFVTVVDGFFVSDNVGIVETVHLDTGFAYSDHNPVALTFTLIPAK